MALVPLTHEHIGALDQGAAGLIIDAAIREAIHDLEDRGKDGKSRQVVVVVDLKLGEREDIVDAHVEAGVKVPRRRTASHLGKVRHEKGQPQMMFQQYAPEDPTQRTIDDYRAEGEVPNA